MTIQKLKNVSLLEHWAQSQRAQLTCAEAAATLGVTAGQYRQRLDRERAALPPIAESRYPKYDGALTITDDALVLCDPHAPLHHAEFINHCVKLATAWGITTVILAGDTVEASAFSHWPEGPNDGDRKTLSSAAENKLLDMANNLNPADAALLRSTIMEMTREPGDISEELTEAKKFVTQLISHFARVVWCMGNHEDRVTRLLNKSMSAVDLAALFGGSSPRLTLSDYYYCTLVSGGVSYRITHPTGAGKGASSRLASKYLGNIIMAHNHHFSVRSDVSNTFVCIEPGMCADLSRLAYQTKRDSMSETPHTGAVIIRNGHYWLLDLNTDWNMLERAC